MGEGTDDAGAVVLEGLLDGAGRGGYAPKFHGSDWSLESPGSDEPLSIGSEGDVEEAWRRSEERSRMEWPRGRRLFVTLINTI